MYYFRHIAMPHHDPDAISRLARSMGYYEVELPSMQESRGRRFRHLTKLGGVTVDVYYKSTSVQVSHVVEGPSYYQKESDLAIFHQAF